MRPVTDRRATTRHAWILAVLVYLASSACISLYKLSPSRNGHEYAGDTYIMLCEKGRADARSQEDFPNLELLWWWDERYLSVHGSFTDRVQGNISSTNRTAF
jgi:hypothetical protein